MPGVGENKRNRNRARCLHMAAYIVRTVLSKMRVEAVNIYDCISNI